MIGAKVQPRRPAALPTKATTGRRQTTGNSARKATLTQDPLERSQLRPQKVDGAQVSRDPRPQVQVQVPPSNISTAAPPDPPQPSASVVALTARVHRESQHLSEIEARLQQQHGLVDQLTYQVQNEEQKYIADLGKLSAELALVEEAVASARSQNEQLLKKESEIVCETEKLDQLLSRLHLQMALQFIPFPPPVSLNDPILLEEDGDDGFEEDVPAFKASDNPPPRVEVDDDLAVDLQRKVAVRASYNAIEQQLEVARAGMPCDEPFPWQHPPAGLDFLSMHLQRYRTLLLQGLPLAWSKE